MKPTGIRKKRLANFGKEARFLLANLNVSRILLVVGTGLILMAISISLSRGGMIAAMTGVIASILFLFRRKQVRSCILLILFLVPIGGLALAWTGLQGEVGDRLETLQEDDLLERELRPQLWKDGLDAVKDFPILGSGFGTYRYIYREYQSFEDTMWFYHAENVYVELLITGGIFSLALLLAIAAYILTVAIFLPTKNGNPLNLAVGSFGFFILVSQAVSNFFDFGLLIPANGVTFAVLAGAVVGASRSKLKGDKDKTYNNLFLPKFATWPVLGLLIAGGVVSGLYFFPAHYSETAVKKARTLTPESLTVEEITERIDLLEKNSKQIASLEVHEFLSILYWLRFQNEFVNDQLESLPEDSQLTRKTIWENSTIRMLNFQLAKMTPSERDAQLESVRGKSYYDENIPKSIEHAEKALKLCPLSVRSILCLAEYCYFNNLRPQPYVRAFNQFNVQNAGYFQRMGDLTAAHGLERAAFDNWKEAMKIRPDAHSAIVPAAILFFDKERVCSNLIPENASLLVNVADKFFAGDANDSYRQILFRRTDAILKKKPINDAASNYLLGRTHVELGDPQSAVTYYEIATSLEPLKLDWKVRLAELYWMLGNREKARAVIEECTIVEPGNATYLRLQKTYQQ